MISNYLKDKLTKSSIALFEVYNNKYIKWKNNFFDGIFSFISKNQADFELSFKATKNSINLNFNKKNIIYKCELIFIAGKYKIYKINDNQIPRILSLKDGIECFQKGAIKFAVQKQVNISTMSTLGYEFLARMYLKDGSLVSNEVFMPIIESSYQQKILLPLAIKKVFECKNYVKNKVNWLNISAELLESRTFHKEFIKIINSYPLKNTKIGIEITESHKIISNKNMIDSLVNLKKENIYIAIDDFGAGYANIRRLSILPVDIVKLDKTFLYDIKNKKTQSIIKGLVNIGKSIGFSVLAEGIETKSDLIYAKKLGVKFGQGWYIKRPEIL